ncbi:MAG: histidine kinase [Acidobacteriia bacterium]|nr:histidine kinase [Terriglobia bacterium]
MPPLSQPLLINILGHTAGTLIFAIFLVLVYSGRGWSGGRGRYLSGLAATLSLMWNLGSLIVLAAPDLHPGPTALVVAVSFSAFSLLPAVLLHISIEDSWLVRAGYVLSAIAIGMHFRELYGDTAALHQSALLLITAGFLLLTAIAVFGPAVRSKSAGRWRGTRILGAMCLALFTTSFVHFGAAHASEAWSSELLVHHAGIPLALLILLQDYRFVLLDAFIRFLANAFLAVLLSGLMIVVALPLLLGKPLALDAIHQALLFVSLCLAFVLFAWLRNQVQAWLTHGVFRPGAVAGLATRVKDCPAFANAEQYLNWAAALIAAGVRTNQYVLEDQNELAIPFDLRFPVLASAFPGFDSSRRWSWAEVLLPLRLGPGNSKAILLGRRQGGQPYLGEDLEALAKAAAEMAEQVESLRRREMSRLVSQAELRALQSQINPHFLFNALNTLFGSIPREAGAARRMVLNLADIFRYFLQSEKTYVPLGQEMQIVRAYLEVEQLRLGGRLAVEIRMDNAALEVPIPVLSVQPLVENAIKHGVAPRTEPGYVRIEAELRGEALGIVVENSSGGAISETPGAGVGLQNLRRRLEICYGSQALLQLTPSLQNTRAKLSIPLTRVHAAV